MKPSALLAITLLALVLPLAAAGDTGATGEISFEKDLMPTLKRRCAACHITGTEPGQMALVPGKAYDFLVNVDSVEAKMKRVAPGDPGQSYLIHKLQGTHLDVGGNGVRMPFHQGPLPQGEIDRFRQWIAEGADKN